MTRKLICGFETGDSSEISSVGAGFSVVSSTFRSGAYALKNDATGTGAMYFDLGSANAVAHPRVRGYIRFAANSGSAQYTVIGDFYNTSFSHQCQVVLARDPGWFVYCLDSSFAVASGFNSITSLNANQWYLFEIDLTPGAGTGALDLYIAGTNVLSVTGKQFGTGSTEYFETGIVGGVAPGAGFDFYVDDIGLDDAALLGEGTVIARQVISGTPTYDNWTKVG